MAEIGTCFSAALIWRCSGLRTIENQVLIIGPSIQLLFSVLLLIINGRRRPMLISLLLSLEGIFYFAFSLCDLLTKLLAAVQHSLPIFTIMDIVLAAGSAIPILLYTAFIFAYFRNYIISELPQRFKHLVQALLILFIAILAILVETASFVGIRRALLSLDPTSRPIVGIGFDLNSSGQSFWQFFTAFSVIILSVYQFLAFSAVFYRIIMVALNQWKFEQTNTDKTHLFMGLGWMALGFKAGAMETILALLPPSFGLQMTRRLLRAVSRASLCVGVVKGPDSVWDFIKLKAEMGGPSRRSRLLQAIGNPRHSTFLHLNASPVDPDYSAEVEKRQPTEAVPRDRVTVQYTKGTPKLQMRFSELNMPSVAAFAKNMDVTPESHEDVRKQEERKNQALASSTQTYSHHPSSSVAETLNTMAAVEELAPHFPELSTQAEHNATHSGAVPRSRASVRASSQLLSSYSQSVWYPISSPVVEESNTELDSIQAETPRQRSASFSDENWDTPPPHGRFHSDLSASSPLSRIAERSTNSLPPEDDRNVTPRHTASLGAANYHMANTPTSGAFSESSKADSKLVNYTPPSRTPTFSKNGHARGSVHLMIQPPPSRSYEVEAYQSDHSSTSSPVLRDEEVIEMERANMR